MAKKKGSAREFDKWLKERNMTTEQFSLLADVSYHTVTKWRNGVQPRAFVKKALHPKFPTCPLFA